MSQFRNYGVSWVAKVCYVEELNIAWIETPEGQRLEINRSLTFGRKSGAGRVQIADPTVSNIHAGIFIQTGSVEDDTTDDGVQYWAIDYGSTNGTKLNRHRLWHPVRLVNEDRLEIRGHVFVFRQAGSKPAGFDSTGVPTLPIAEVEDRWLFLADIEDFSRLANRHADDLPGLAILVGRWLERSKRLIEVQKGEINKFGGDGFLAFWARDTLAESMVGHLRAWLEEIEQSTPLFRVVIHFASVAVGGAPTMGEESLVSADLNFLFRMEKMAAALRIPMLLSAAAGERLQAHWELQVVESCGPLKGVIGTPIFYRPK